MQVVIAANEVIDSIDKDELSKYLAQKSDPEDEEADKTKKKMEMIRDQLADSLYQKGIALYELSCLKILWFYPLYAFSIILSAIWYNDFAKHAYIAMRKPKIAPADTIGHDRVAASETTTLSDKPRGLEVL